MSAIVDSAISGLVARLPAASAEEQVTLAGQIASAVAAAGPAAFKASGATATLIAQLNETNKTTKIASALGALVTFKAVVDASPQWIEPFAIAILPSILETFGENKLQAASEAAGRALINKVNPFALRPLLAVLYQGFESIKWQTKQASIVFIGALAQRQDTLKPFGQVLPDVILKLLDVINDASDKVRKATLEVFPIVCAVITNPDVQPAIPHVIAAYAKPVDNTQNALDRLLSTTFVNTVDTPTLGLLVPILIRAMRERKVVFKRRSAVIMENMCKLVVDPRDAAQFYPILEPILTKAMEEIAVAEVREVCQKALATLKRVMGEAASKTASLLSREDVLATMRSAVTVQGGLAESALEGVEDVLTFSADLCSLLVTHQNTEDENWEICIRPYFEGFLAPAAAAAASAEVTGKCKALAAPPKEVEEDIGEVLCDCQFSLAYGSRVLLHQTPFKIFTGRRYGLVGPNGAGKSTLMRSIASGNLAGFPTELRTVYVECHIDEALAEMPVFQYMLADEKLVELGATEQMVREALASVGFSPEMTNGPIAALSGGWKMKLALSRAMLLTPDMLLLDEPTNHLDQFAVKWLTEYILNLKKCTCLIVSHDTGFLDRVCTNIIHYENLKLKSYLGNLSKFVEQKPEARSYYELTSDIVAFNFPDPGPLEGVKSLTRAVLKMRGGSFQYPTSPRPQLIDVSIQASLASRVAVVGVNGAGKSTLIKLMVGEIEVDSGEVERHPNLRVAYVAQHAFHHIEQHLDKSPAEYLMWRYAAGVDKEQVAKEALKMSEEEAAAIAKAAKENKSGIVEKILGRRNGKREHEYEVQWEGGIKPNEYLTRSELEALGYQKMVQEYDEFVAMQRMGQRQLTTGEICRHFDQFGLEEQFSVHGTIGGLSGGQKVKVVLGAAFWNHPHIIILDEPTNFLDRDSLGALATAIKNFKGGVFMISHNAEFYEALCPERWLLESGYLSVQGAEWMAEVEAARLRAEKAAAKKLPQQADDKFDAFGNKIEEKKAVKELSRADRKKLEKQRKDLEKKGEDTYEIDLILGLITA